MWRIALVRTWRPSALPCWAKELNLYGNKIGDVGAEKLATALPSLANLQNLDLSRNDIGDNGAEQLASALPSLTSLQDSRLNSAKISETFSITCAPYTQHLLIEVSRFKNLIWHLVEMLLVLES